MKRFSFILSLAACLALAASAAEIPRTAPEDMVLLTTGKQVKVSEYKGKVVVLSYILTT